MIIKRPLFPHEQINPYRKCIFQMQKNSGILDRSVLETMKNSLFIIDSDAKANPLWNSYGETFTDLNSSTMMEIWKNSKSTQ